MKGRTCRAIGLLPAAALLLSAGGNGRGQTWSGPELIDAATGYTVYNPNIALAAGGRALAVFTQSDGYYSRVYANLWDGQNWGGPVDVDFATETDADLPAIFRSTSGLWAVRELTRAYFGSAGDLPITR